MKIDKNNPAEMAAALKRIPLRKVYDACNQKYFFGKLPPANVRWVTGNEPFIRKHGMPEGAHWSKRDREIRLRTSALARHPGDYQFFRVLVHEMTHAFIDLVLGEREHRLLKNGTKKRCHHGELFGRESRRIAEIDGSPVNYRDRQFGNAGKKWALEESEVELEDGTVIPRAEYLKRRRSEAKTRRQRQAIQEGFWLTWTPWAIELQDELHANTDQHEVWQIEPHRGQGCMFGSGAGRDYFFNSIGQDDYERCWQLYWTRLGEEAKRKLKAQTFKARLAAIPIEQQIECLRKRVANPKTPPQFRPGIEAKLGQLLRQGQ